MTATKKTVGSAGSKSGAPNGAGSVSGLIVKVAPVPKDVVALQSQVTTLVIKNVDDLTQASVLREMLKKKQKSIDEEKAKMLKPILEAEKVERARWKPQEDIIKSALLQLDSSMSAYQTEARKRELEAEKKIAEQMDKGTIKPTTAIRKMGEIERSATKVTTSVGSTGFVTTPFCELEDIKLVPMEYHEVDMTKIRKLMLAGVKVKGIRYWTEERPRSGR